MKLTLGEAARHSGRAKATLSQALKSGKLSATKNDNGAWEIDPSELTRWLDSNSPQTVQKTEMEPLRPDRPNRSEPSNLREELAAIRAKLEMMETERERERATAADQIEHLRSLLEREQEERRALSQRLLAAPEKPRESASSSPGWFGSLFRRNGS